MQFLRHPHGDPEQFPQFLEILVAIAAAQTPRAARR